MPILHHPRRPRGSQGREKGYRLSPNYFQKFKRMPAPAWHKKCFVLLCPIGEQCLLSSFCEFVHDGYCLATLAQLVHQGKLLFSTFLTRNEGTTDESKKRLGCYQQEQFNLPREYSVFDLSQCIVNNKKLKMRRRRESQKSNSLTRQNNNFARASHFICTFFAVNCTTTRENA